MTKVIHDYPLPKDDLISVAHDDISKFSRDVFTTKQAADYLGLSKQRLEIWRHDGNGPPYVKLARSVRYMREDIDAWLKLHRRSNTSQQGMEQTNDNGES